MKARAIRVFIVTLVLVTMASPLSADCDRWECRRTIDTASCWIRYGSLANKFRLGSNCEETAQCMWYYYESIGWITSCNYDCRITGCYEI